MDAAASSAYAASLSSVASRNVASILSASAAGPTASGAGSSSVRFFLSSSRAFSFRSGHSHLTIFLYGQNRELFHSALRQAPLLSPPSSALSSRRSRWQTRRSLRRPPSRGIRYPHHPSQRFARTPTICLNNYPPACAVYSKTHRIPCSLSKSENRNSRSKSIGQSQGPLALDLCFACAPISGSIVRI